jgi:hypothetical protein
MSGRIDMSNIIEYIKDNNNKLFLPMVIGMIFIGSLLCGLGQYFSYMWRSTHIWYYVMGECFFMSTTLLSVLITMGYGIYSIINFLEGLR